MLNSNLRVSKPAQSSKPMLKVEPSEASVPAVSGTPEPKLEDDDEPPKPPPSFNGILSKFAFTATSTASNVRITRSSNAISSPVPASKKRSLSSTPDIPSGSSTPAKKKKRTTSKYADPSKYAHLTGIPDAFQHDLICLFVGLNPGIATAVEGHAYSAKSNLFWKLLHSSGLTPDRRRPATDDQRLPTLYSLGNTNLVSRPTKDQAELSKAEMDYSVSHLEAKIRHWRPESVCIVGKGIWESIWRVKHAGRSMKKELGFKFGWVDEWCDTGEGRMGGTEDWEGTRVFVTMSTSGLVAGYSPAEKEACFKELGDWVQMRRKERGETAPKVSDQEAEACPVPTDRVYDGEVER